MPNDDTDDLTQDARDDIRMLQHELRTLLTLWVQHADAQGQPQYGRAVVYACVADLLGQLSQEVVDLDPAQRERCEAMIDRLKQYIAPPLRAH